MLTQEQIHALRKAAEHAWGDDTRHRAYRGHPVPAVGQCYNTAKWLQSRLGGNVARKDGCYFWTDGEHALDLCGDRHILPPADPSIQGIRFSEEDPGLTLHDEHLRWRSGPMLYKRITHPYFKGHEIVSDEDPHARAKRFMLRADRALDGHIPKHSLDLGAGDAYPAEEPQAIENYEQRYMHDSPMGEAGPKTYNVVYGNGALHLSPDHSHQELAEQAGISVDYTGPFAAGFVTVNMGKANWQLRSNVALHALERVLKDYDKHMGWEWGGLVDSSGQPINDDFAPKKSETLFYGWLADSEHLYLSRSAWDLAERIQDDYDGWEESIGEVVGGLIQVEGSLAKVAHFEDRPYLFDALQEWAGDEGLRLMAGDNVIKRIEDLETDNLWSPTDNEPEGTQFFNQPKRDERAPGGVFKCPECHRIFPRWDLYIDHREKEEPMGDVDTTVQPSKFPEPNMDATFPNNFSEQSFEPSNIVAGFNGVVLRTSNREAAQVPGVNQRYFRHASEEYWTAYENGCPVGCAALEGDNITWISSPLGFHVTDAILARLKSAHDKLSMHLADEYLPNGTRVAASEEFDLLTRAGFIYAGSFCYRWSADQDPSKLLDAAVPFIYDVDKDSVTVGHPGERHSDIQGKFTPGGIVEGTYEPGGKVIVRSLTSMPYTVRHMLELWYYQHPEYIIKSVHLRDDEGKDTKLARTAMAADPNWLNAWIKANGPYAYHAVWPRDGVDVSQQIESIKREGLIPGRRAPLHKQEPQIDPDDYGTEHDWLDWFQTPRPGHVYLGLPGAPHVHGQPHTFRVDLRKLDPARLNPDEDHLHENDHTLPARFPGRTLGEIAEHLDYGADPVDTAASAEEYDTLAHRGPIPPQALEYIGPYHHSKVGRPITSGMEIGQAVANLAAQDDAVWRAYQALKKAGGRCYIVGGAVRDVAMGKDPKDLDMMVTGLPHDAVLKALKRLPGKVAEHGQDFSVIRYIEPGVGEVEIALPRRERSTGPGHGDFDVQADHTMSPEEDFYRRDFNVNAMGVDLDTGKLVDPFGGTEAIRQGTFATTSGQSFKDDPLRTLRALTLSSRHGLKPDEATKEQMAHYAERLTHLPAERIQAELDKIFAGDDPEAAIRLAHETGVLPYVLPDVARAMGFDQYNVHHPEGDLGEHLLMVMRFAKQQGADPDLVLAALLHDIGKVDSQWFECKPCSKIDHDTGLRIKNPIASRVCPECGQDGQGHYYEWHQENPDGSRTVWGADHEAVGAEQADKLLRRLKYPTDRVARITHLIRHHMYDPFTSAKGARRFINRVGDEHADDLMLLRQADQGGKLEYPSKIDQSVGRERELVQQVRETGQPTGQASLAINGHDLMAAGFKPGPEMGEILRHLTELVLDNPEANNRETLLNAAKLYVPA